LEKTAKLRGFSGAFPQFLHTFTDLAAKKIYGNTWKLQIVQAAGAETNGFLSLFTGKYTQKSGLPLDKLDGNGYNENRKSIPADGCSHEIGK
jgi:hypothetical protein